MKVFEKQEAIFTYNFFDPDTENPLFRKKLCFERHEISPMISDYFFEHTDRDKETIAIVINLLNELNTVLTALDPSIYKNIPKEKITTNCNLLENEIKSAEDKTFKPEQKKLIDGCILYCTTAIGKQLKQLTNLPETDLFKRCENNITLHL